MAEYGLSNGTRLIEVGSKKYVKRIAYDLIKRKRLYSWLDLVYEPNQADMSGIVGRIYWDFRHGVVLYKDEIEQSITQVEPDGSCHF